MRRRHQLNSRFQSEENGNLNNNNNNNNNDDDDDDDDITWNVDSNIKEYFNYKPDNNDNDDDIYDKLIDKQIESLSRVAPRQYNNKVKSSNFFKIFSIFLIIFLILLILFISLILLLEAYDLKHPFYMHLLKLLQYVHYTSKGLKSI